MVNALAGNGDIGAFVLLADTLSGEYPYRPTCSICIHIFPPSSCTALVMILCFSASSLVSMALPIGNARPARLGAIPPVTIKPTCPLALSA